MRIAVLAVLTAFASFIHEINLSQALSAALGGTILRYHTGFGLFTCFLGLGALAFERLRRHFSPTLLLIWAQVAMIAFGLVGPLWIEAMSPFRAPQAWQFSLTALAYLPLIVIAFVSGLELPALMSLRTRDSQNGFAALGWDYVGMFAAALTYPLVFLYFIGVWGAAWVAAWLNAMALLMVLWSRRKELQSQEHADTPTTDVDSESARVSPALAGGLIFTVSFCSMAYELLGAKAVSDMIHDEVLAHALSIGMFLLGLGLGTFHARRVRAVRKALLWIELALTLLGAFSLVIVMTLATAWNVAIGIDEGLRGSSLGVLLFAPLPLVIGYLSGYELPLLLRLWRGQARLGVALSLSYAGALVAGFAVPLLLLPAFGTGPAFVLVALLNLIAAALVLDWRAQARWQIAAFIICGLAVTQAVRGNHFSEQMFLKSYYFELRVEDLRAATLSNFLATLNSFKPIQRITTQYQSADVIERDTGAAVFTRNEFTLYLNRQPQFSSNAWKTYHESLVYGAVNLAGKAPQHILLLGGGDGILAGELLRQFPSARITLVELDSAIVNLSRTHPEILHMNRGALDDQRVNVVIDDAYAYVHRATDQFDAAFLDFPYPMSFELSRLYSAEFYSALRLRLRPDGFMIMDAPIWFELEREHTTDQAPHVILFNTLLTSGFSSLMTFGPIEPFLFAKVAPATLAFDYADFPPDLANATFVNLTSIRHLTEPFPRGDQFVNSVFRPKRFMQ